MRKIIYILLTVTQLVSCQNTINPAIKDGFEVREGKLYYNQKNIDLKGNVKRAIEVFGDKFRIYESSYGGQFNEDWMWKKKLITVNKHSDNNYYSLRTLYYDKDKNEYLDDTNHKDYLKEYKSLKEIIKKYGKYDTYEKNLNPITKSKEYVWDDLGVSISVDPDSTIIIEVSIHILHISKEYKLNLKDNNDYTIFMKSQKKEYKGNFTYNGNTVNFEELGYENWDGVVNGLKISGEDYDPAGDSDDWGREIREPKIVIAMERRKSGIYQVQENPPVDSVNSIGIYSNEK